MGVSLRSAVPSVAAALAGAAALAVTREPPRITADIVRDLLYARDCVELGKCHTLGASTSTLGLYQGGGWTGLLVVVTLLGGGYRAVQAVVVALAAASVGALHRATTLWISRDAAWPVAIAYLAFLLAAGDHADLWNPSLLPLPLVSYVWALTALARTGRPRFAVVAACLLALTAEGHVGTGLSLLPSLLFSIAATSSRPSLTLVGSVVTVPAVIALASPDALAANAASLVAEGRLAAFLAAVAASIGLGFGLRRGLATRATPRLIASLAMTALPSVVGQLWLVSSRATHFELRYVYPVAVVLSLALGPVIVGLARRLATRASATAPSLPAASAAIASLLLFVALGFARRNSGTEWTLADLDAVSAHAAVSKRSYAAIKQGVQGPECYGMVAGLALDAPLPPGDGTPAPDLLAVRLPKDGRLPDAATPNVVEHRDGRLLLRRIDSWIDRRSGEVCYEPLEPAGERRCVSLGADRIEEVPPDRFLFAFRSYPDVHGLRESGKYLVRYTLQVRPTGPDRERTLTLADPDGPCAWVIEPGGTKHEPVRSIVLRATEPGPLVFSREYGSTRCSDLDRRVPPCFVETRPDETWLRTLTDEARR